MAFSAAAGGTLTLPSPSPVHPVDAGSSVPSLRRSMSRSPSRFHLVRAESHGSQNSSSSRTSLKNYSPHTPCPPPHAHAMPASAPGLPTSLSVASSLSSLSNDCDYDDAMASPLATVAGTAAAAAAAGQAEQATPVQTSTPSIFTTPLRTGVKLSLRSVRPKTTGSKPAARLIRYSPKSPLKRALSVNADMGNGAPTPPGPTSHPGPSTALSEPLLGHGQENNHISTSAKFSSILRAFGSPSRNSQDRPSRHSMHLDLSGDVRDALASVTSSPLKRSDAIMNLDQANRRSPVAKRRSLHGVSSLGSDFNVFDFAPPPDTAPPSRTSFEICEDGAGREDQLTDTAMTSTTPPPSTTPEPASAPFAPPSASPSPSTAVPAPVFSAAAPADLHSLSLSSASSSLAKRASSLRKSTLQQRHDPRSSWGRRQGEKYLAQQMHLQASPQQPKMGVDEWTFTPPHIRTKPRASLDQLLKPEPRESPFRNRGPLPNPSLHGLDRPPLSLFGGTTGTTGPAAGAVPHQHQHQHQHQQPHQPHPLSRTLTTSSSGSSMPDDSPTHFPVQLPPDRPRPASLFARSLPLTAHRPRAEPVATPQYKSARPLQSVFASAGLVSKMNRNVDDEAAQLRGSDQSLVMPDTPCKKQVYPSNTYPPSSGSGRKQGPRRFFISAAHPETPFNNVPVKPRGASANNAGESVVNFFKLRSSHTRKASILSIDGDVSDSQGATDMFDLPPTPTKSVLAKNIFGSANKSHATPQQTARDPPTGPTGFTPSPVVARRRASIPMPSPGASSDSERSSPKTPRESSILHNLDHARSMGPPGSNRIPLFASRDGVAAPMTITAPSRKLSPTSATFPPATPTADREAFAGVVDYRASITPVHGAAAPSDADAVLGSMFGKVACIGKGEFSQVFRVSTRQGSVRDRAASDYFSFSTTPSKSRIAATPTNVLPAASAAEKVYAVKKVRLPIFGQKERQAKLREVAVLEAVRDCENVLQVFDHWEQNGHLYIQTEFCDEGGLDSFLRKAGEHGRLDDFRIWKILLEMSQGLRYVHDAGFVHLDLKPANVFVTYEGHLKIGDFGMAAQWPVPKGIEGEGDREYIGPEILRGEYDKPADVFSLGLIVLEIACNVFLPDNGPIWVALREGDMSVVPSLTAGEANALLRDDAGMPVISHLAESGHDGYAAADALDLASTTPGRAPPPTFEFGKARQPAGNILGSLVDKKPMGLERPPGFMVNQYDAGSLDSVVATLINPDPASRPTVHEILETASLQWVHGRRRAPATIFEGNWGPEDDEDDTQPTAAELDTEMTDV